MSFHIQPLGYWVTGSSNLPAVSWDLLRSSRRSARPAAVRLSLPHHFWLVVWNMTFVFPYIGNNHPNWLSYFQRGWNHQVDSMAGSMVVPLGDRTHSYTIPGWLASDWRQKVPWTSHGMAGCCDSDVVLGHLLGCFLLKSLWQVKLGELRCTWWLGACWFSFSLDISTRFHASVCGYAMCYCPKSTVWWALVFGTR